MLKEYIKAWLDQVVDQVHFFSRVFTLSNKIECSKIIDNKLLGFLLLTTYWL